jgi:hypothetical protein
VSQFFFEIVTVLCTGREREREINHWYKFFILSVNRQIYCHVSPSINRQIYEVYVRQLKIYLSVLVPRNIVHDIPWYRGIYTHRGRYFIFL